MDRNSYLPCHLSEPKGIVHRRRSNVKQIREDEMVGKGNPRVKKAYGTSIGVVLDSQGACSGEGST
jgi:hypothetical protein